jgi:hypothetical protein
MVIGLRFLLSLDVIPLDSIFSEAIEIHLFMIMNASLMLDDRQFELF